MLFKQFGGLTEEFVDEVGVCGFLGGGGFGALLFGGGGRPFGSAQGPFCERIRTKVGERIRNTDGERSRTTVKELGGVGKILHFAQNDITINSLSSE